MSEIKLSQASVEALASLQALYDKGEVFVPGEYAVRRTAQVEEARKLIARTVGKDLAEHAGVKNPTMFGCTIVYNLQVLIETAVGGGYCAIGVWDSKTKTCRYIGIVKCNGRGGSVAP